MRITLMLYPTNTAGAAWFLATQCAGEPVNLSTLHVFATELLDRARVMTAYRRFVGRDHDA